MSMTDEQIVKALECCVRYENYLACRGCPFSESGVCEEDGLALQKYSLDLIKRQQEEIERFADIGKMYSEVRDKAVREFAEKYKTEVTNRYEDIAYKDLFFGVIDNLVREMTEKEGGKE